MKKVKSKMNITRIILENGGDIMASPNMQSEKTFMQHRKVNCYDHSLSVAYVSVWLSNRLKLKNDFRSMIRGALLHDYFLYDWHTADKTHKLHGFIHAQIALKNAKRDFTINKIEADIIAKHMFPLNIRLPKYKESVIVNIADKICAVCEICSINLSSPMLVSEIG